MKANRFTLLFAMISILVASQTAFGEYIFYKKNGDVIQAINESDHQKIYPKIIRYTFPMNANLLMDFSELSQAEIQEMFQHEQQFLQKNIGSEYSVQFIPTILYELLVARAWVQFKLIVPSYHENITTYSSVFKFPESRIFWKEKTPFLAYVTKENPVKELLRDLNEIWLKNTPLDNASRTQGTFRLYQQLNNLPDIQALHLIINNEILAYLATKSIDAQKIDEPTTALAILHDLCTYFAAMTKRLELTFSGIMFETVMPEGFTNEEVLQKAVAVELEAAKKDAFVIYRGTGKLTNRGNKIDSTLTFREGALVPNSISYGNSLYAALFGDDCKEKGAMAYHYIEKSDLAYALLINKYDMVAGNLKNLFHIPPILTLVGLVSQGEFFHTRTKAVVPQNDQKLCGIWFFSGTGPFNIPEFLINMSGADHAMHEALFSEYLVNNIIILRNKTSFSDQDLLNYQRKPLDPQSYNSDPKDIGGYTELNYIVQNNLLVLKKFFMGDSD